MKRTKIAWVKNNDGSQGYTWNPVTGCQQGCSYCYARILANRFGKSASERAFAPAFRPERMLQPFSLPKAATIFVCSMADLFGIWVPARWIEDVVKTVKESQGHTFLFLTKNGIRMRWNRDLMDTRNAWCGQTCTGINDRALWNIPNRSFLSLEPLLGDWLPDLRFLNIQWVLIGALNINGRPVHPDNLQYRGTRKEWVLNALEMTNKYNIPVFIKPELYQLYPDLPLRQEMPYLQDWKGK